MASKHQSTEQSFQVLLDRIYEAAACQESNVFNTYSPLWSDYLAERGELPLAKLDDLLCSNQSSGTTGETSDPHLYKQQYEEMLDTHLLDRHPLSPVGRPQTFDFKGRPASVSYLDRLALVSTLESMVDLPEQLDILEVGAGYGAFAYFMIKTGRARSYTIIDLPENLVNSAYYLSSNFPSLPINVCGGQEGINLVPPGQVKTIAAQKFDLAVNTDSLGEMVAETAQAYVELIHHHLRDGGLFFSKNGHRRSRADGVQRVSEFGYSRFSLRALVPSVNASSAFDDFSHLVLLEKKPQGMTEEQTRFLDTLANCYAAGLHDDLREISARLARKTMLPEDTAFLDWATDFFLKAHEEYDGTYLACARYLLGLRRSVHGNLDRDSLRYYIDHGASWAARLYCYMLLSQGRPGSFCLPPEHSNHHMKEIEKILRLPIGARQAAFHIRVDNLRKKVDLDWKPSTLRTVKDVLFNLRERRLSLRR